MVKMIFPMDALVKRKGLTMLAAGCTLAVLARSPTRGGPPECPAASSSQLLWVTTTDRDVGVEISHPFAYDEKHWGSRTDSSRAAFSLWRDAVNGIDFNGIGRITITGTTPCVVQSKSGPFTMGLQRSPRRMPDGRDSIYFIGRGSFTPPGKKSVVVDISAEDSTEMLKQLAMLRTIRFVK